MRIYVNEIPFLNSSAESLENALVAQENSCLTQSRRHGEGA